MADVIRKRISAKNIPIIVDKIAENVFPLCPFNRRRVTAVDSMAHMILDAIGGHPAIDFNPFPPPIQKIAAARTAAHAKRENVRS